ncbi:MAG: hypothetical protein ABSD31_05790 [Candidatus Binataceae bacterium]|jgi:hypothetical protein
MVEDKSPRHKSVGAALRFYFRAGEVLSSKASNRLHLEGRIPATGHSPRQDLMLDYLTIAACLKDLNELQLWLLRELYRPTRIGKPIPSVTQACDAGRRIFPRVRWTVQGVGRLHRHTLRIIEDRLVDKGLILSAPPSVFVSRNSGSATHSPGIHQGVVHEFRFERASTRPSIHLGPGAPEHAHRGPARFAPRRRREVVFSDSRSRS